MSTPPPPHQPPGGQPGSPEEEPAHGTPPAPAAGGFGPPTPASPPPSPTPAMGTPGGPVGAEPGTPPSVPAVPPQGQPGQPGYGYPQAPPAGYGYPQTPPQAGYGFPQTPPQAGYGFPQGQTQGGAPSQQPTLGGGFSAATPPGPYGAPGVGGPQGTFGGPGGFGGQGTPPPGPGGAGGAGRGKLLLVVGLVLVGLLGIGGAFWALSGDDKNDNAENRDAGGDETPPEEEDTAGPGEGDDDEGAGGGSLPSEPISASLAWEVAPLEVSADDILVRSKAVWFIDDALVRVLGDELISYDIATGQENWSLPFELSGGDCNASANVDDNRIAILQGRDCEVISVVDISAGQEVTSIPINNSITPDKYDFPAILGDTVAVSWGIGGGGYQISTGEQLWVSEGNCAETSYMVVETQFVSLLECGWLAEDGGTLRATDEAGNPDWEWDFAELDGEQMEIRSVLSLDPLTVVVRTGEAFGESTEQIVVVNEGRTEIEHVLDYDIDRYVAPCENQMFTSCGLGVVSDGYLYLGTQAVRGDGALTAFNLTTGAAEYEVSAINGGSIRPFAAEDGKILAYQPADYELEGMVTVLDPATEALSPLMALDRVAREKEYAMMGGGVFPHDSLPMWKDNTLLLVDHVTYESEESPPSMLAYR
ncbi:hypothetical protein [Streptomyces profundus]|uniref:hypothetical protein n=1 Tax=Streptomyces profundus TaxID=2867410 RepID=UPI001D165B8D|nr:hypothetical protein [Streptomyces sp. MA3_2.13]UED85901.1 hypothetical protein K4G22_18350 [Streptomyces sp. MA3_2.13]